MAVVRYLCPALVGLFLAAQLGAQDATGSVRGTVVDSTTQQPLSSVTVRIEGTQRGTLTREDGGFALTGIAPGVHRVRASRIGYSAKVQDVTVTAGGTATVNLALGALAANLGEIVVTGYGTQRRLAITGSVATIDPEAANVGVTPNVNSMIQGRAAGVNVTQNSGEPGANAQVRIRGGTSITASNEPLYVIDGIPIQNNQTEGAGVGVSGTPPLGRSPLNLLNPADIASISILKDASATAIYGSRGANGVVLIETKKGSHGAATLEYESYVAMSTQANYLDLLDGNEFRAFVREQVAAGNLDTARLSTLGTANTDWERELAQTGVTHNHNLSFSGGGTGTRYRASLNYLDQEGVTLSNGFERIQGRLNGSHNTFNDRLRLSLNLTASHIKNDYLAYNNTGGFEGGVFQNAVTFNPTRPVTVTDTATGQTVFFEVGAGSQSVRNPIGLAEQIQDEARTTRTLGNVTGEWDIFPSLTGQVTVGVDRSDGTRSTYFPRASPVGAGLGGFARQDNLDNLAVTLQTLMTFRQLFAGIHDFDIVGGYEFNDFNNGEFRSDGRNFSSDAFSFNNLGASGVLLQPFSFREKSRLISFFSRANYSLRDRYFLTAVLRRDGSSRFGAGNKWALFPALSGSWRISEEAFFPEGFLSDLRLRAGWGRQGNQAVPPYSSLISLGADGGARYVFGDAPVTGIAPLSNPNPNLKWEETDQYNLALDYGFLNNRFSGSLEYYIKNTSDLLLRVDVPQPAVVSRRLENVGKVRNKGLEMSLDAQVMSRPNLNWLAGLVFSADRNEVVDLGGRPLLTTGSVSGEGQSDQRSQALIPGEPLGTFYGPEFVGVNDAGKQLFNEYEVTRDPAGFVTSRRLIGQTTSPSGDDFVVIGNANPSFTLGLRSQATWNKFDASFLIRAEQGKDVFNNTALVYATRGNAKRDRNFLRSALNDPVDIDEPAIYSSRWIEDGSFVRLQNITVGYTFGIPRYTGPGRNIRAYVSGDNLLLLTGYDGYDPEVHTDAGIDGLVSRGIDYLTYPRARTFTAGLRVGF
ncbi:MAG: SusC/RagA family TonB-linked outer membrane protein [Anaerolineae bacterium]|nr:SusC/RagA family TonB-linked outer membrane protein [Gemmatimonadaceae bacterium]